MHNCMCINKLTLQGLVTFKNPSFQPDNQFRPPFCFQRNRDVSENEWTQNGFRLTLSLSVLLSSYPSSPLLQHSCLVENQQPAALVTREKDLLWISVTRLDGSTTCMPIGSVGIRTFVHSQTFCFAFFKHCGIYI